MSEFLKQSELVSPVFNAMFQLIGIMFPDADDDDDDIEAGGRTSNYNCPLTLRPLKNAHTR
jgi:hypothetical protein